MGKMTLGSMRVSNEKWAWKIVSFRDACQLRHCQISNGSDVSLRLCVSSGKSHVTEEAKLSLGRCVPSGYGHVIKDNTAFARDAPQGSKRVKYGAQIEERERRTFCSAGD